MSAMREPGAARRTPQLPIKRRSARVSLASWQRVRGSSPCQPMNIPTEARASASVRPVQS